METKEAVIVILAAIIGSLLVGAVTMQREIFPYSRIALILISVGLAVTGVVGVHLSKPKKPKIYLPYSEKTGVYGAAETLKDKVKNSLALGIMIFDICGALLMPIFTWQYYTTNGKIAPVITLWDVGMILLFEAGIYLFYKGVKAFRES